MGIPKLASLLFLLIFLVRNYPTQATPQEFLDAHNAARRAVGVGPMTWGDKVAIYARDYANKHKGDCNMVHSGGPYGENLAKSPGDLTPAAAVKLWVDEKAYYNHPTNSCSAPPGHTCLHYTQVVWRNSSHLGCAKVRCDNGGTFIICNYNPPGNYVGQSPY